MIRRSMIAAAIAGVALVGAGFFFGGAFAATGEPGTVEDPLVTKSYVDEAVATLARKEYVDQALAKMVEKAYVDQAVARLVERGYVDQVVSGLADKAYVDQKMAGAADKAYVDQKLATAVDKAYLENRIAQMKTLFEVVRVPKDSIILGESGTEIVLRGGKATAIVSAKGGVLDATDGVDLTQGEPVKPNHLLVIPVSDGRGLTAQADLILIVKGPYTVKAPGQ